MSDSHNSRVECLDGLRGLAALWVLVGHAHILSGFRVPIIGDPDLGVDLFVVLSGFLMVFHYRLRENREPWEDTSTWFNFWIRRFFRIAPLYYVLLSIAIIAGPTIYEYRNLIDSINGVPPQPAPRYLDQGLLNWLTHITFTFGFFPNFAYKTALPDWSIGLEAQFYMALPFLMLIFKRFGAFAGTAVIVVTGVVLAYAFRSLGVNFPMPAFLPLKLHVFAVGMIAAMVINEDRAKILLAAIFAVGLMLIPIGGLQHNLHRVVRVSIAIGFFLLVHHDTVPVLGRYIKIVSTFLGNSFFHTLGELSFGAYLIHLLVMQPVVGSLILHTEMNHEQLYFATLAITVPIVYLAAAFGYRAFELRGQGLGRTIVRRNIRAS